MATTNWQKEIQEMYAHHEKEKKRMYNARILQIERGTFSPLVFSCSGGASDETSKFLKTLVRKRSDKRLEPYAATTNFIRRRIRFALLRTCVISLRGDRSRQNGLDNAEKPVTELEIGLSGAE